MGARLNTVFHDGDPNKPRAVVYGHWAGDNPASATETLTDFFAEVKKQTKDTRFNDATYLAAKYVVYLAFKSGASAERPLDFLSVGVVRDEKDSGPECIAYIDCSGRGVPKISFTKETPESKTLAGTSRLT